MRVRRSRKLLFTIIVAFVFSLGTTEMIAQDEQVAKNNAAVVETPAVTDPPAAPTTSRTSPTARTRVGIESAVPVSLSLDEAIRKALANNNTIEITRDDVRFQETQIRSILGFYDPVFTVAPTYTRNSTTGSSSGTNDFSLNADVRHFIRQGGGNYQAFFNNTRTENAFSQQQVSSGSISGSGGSAFYSSQ